MGHQERFRVHRTGKTIQLFGIITDTSNLNVLDEMVSESNVFDCSHVVGASWNGILRLDSYLSQLPGNIVLTQVPYHLFQYLRLLPNLIQKYTLGNIELNLLVSSKTLSSVQTRFVSSDKLQELAHKTLKPFLKLEDGTIVIGRDSFVCPSRFGSRDYNQASKASSWFLQNTEQFDFWYDYTSFANITLALALDLIQSQESTLETIVRDIELTVSGIEKSMSMLIPNFFASEAKDLGAVARFVRTSCDELVLLLDKSSKDGSNILIKMQILAENHDFNDAESLYKLLREFGETVSRLNPALARIEDIGASIGEQISNMSRISTYKTLITAIKPENVSVEVLECVREITNIMDPLSDGDWLETRTEFLQLLDGVEQSLSKIIVLLQGFDLLRQILEHRQQESEAIGDFLNRGGADWRGTKAAVFSLVCRTLVTNQEKYSCEFFIPEASRESDNNQRPGDILLF